MSKADSLPWDKITLGLSRTFEVTLNETMVDSFLKLSGDFNPLHADENYAKNTKFRGRVVPGMLLASFFSQLVGMHLPGKKSLYISQSLAFKNPAFIGTHILVKGTVIRISEPLKMITLMTTISDVNSNKILVEGEGRALYL